MTRPASAYLSPEDLAARYGIDVQAVYHWNHKRTGPPYLRIGRLVRYRLADVTAWENARRVSQKTAS